MNHVLTPAIRSAVLRRLAALATGLLVASLLGCEKKEELSPAETFPGWAYDAPVYYQPSPEMEVERNEFLGNDADDATHYFTNERVVLIRRPGQSESRNVPRLAVWATNVNGYVWRQAGFYGLDQLHFPLVTEEDGAYGIRFVGPGMPIAKTNPPRPMRVYHVDTELPKVDVFIEPNETYYAPAQTIRVSWDVRDPHLPEECVRVFVQMDTGDNEPVGMYLDRTFEKVGSTVIKIPNRLPSTGLRIKVEAIDRAGNVGYGFSPHLQVMQMASDAFVPLEPETIAPQPGDGLEGAVDEFGRLIIETEIERLPPSDDGMDDEMMMEPQSRRSPSKPATRTGGNVIVAKPHQVLTAKGDGPGVWRLPPREGGMDSAVEVELP